MGATHHHHPHDPHDHHRHTPDQHDAPDAWHRHMSDEERPQQPHAERVNAVMVLTMGVAGMILVAGTVVAIVLYFNWYAGRLKAERFEGQTELHTGALAARAEIGAELTTYGWIDPAAGVTRISVSAATERVVAAYAKRTR